MESVTKLEKNRLEMTQRLIQCSVYSLMACSPLLVGLGIFSQCLPTPVMNKWNDTWITSFIPDQYNQKIKRALTVTADLRSAVVSELLEVSVDWRGPH